MDSCPNAPLEEPELTPYQKELNRLTHKQVSAQKDVDNITSERDYILNELKGCKYIPPDKKAEIAQIYANHFEDANGELTWINRQMDDLEASEL